MNALKKLSFAVPVCSHTISPSIGFNSMTREYLPLKLPEDAMRWLQFRARVMTCFMKDIRAMLDKAGEDRGRRLKISVRTDHRDCLRHGLDIQDG